MWKWPNSCGGIYSSLLRVIETGSRGMRREIMIIIGSIGMSETTVVGQICRGGGGGRDVEAFLSVTVKLLCSRVTIELSITLVTCL